MKVSACTLDKLMPFHDAAQRKPLIGDNCLFYAEKPDLLQKVFLSTAVDILLAEPDSHVYYFSIREPSEEDPLFNDLCSLRNVCRFYPVYWSNAHAVLNHLSKTVRTYSYNRFYIFVEDVERCIPRKAWHLLQDIIAIRSDKVRVCLSTLSHFPHPSNIWAKPLSQNMITTACDGSPCLLIPSPDLPAKVQKLKQNRPKNRKNTPPTLTQIILAVTAALLAFIAAQLGG